MARGVSTVLDVSVCLLLIGAAVATLTLAPTAGDEPEPVDADGTATTLATATMAVPTDDGGTSHDTAVGHLATAAAVNATVDGDPVGGFGYPETVRGHTADLVSRRAFVTATWEPYPDAPLAGRLAVGETPPRSATIATTTLSVDSGIDSPTTTESFEAIATELAEAYVRFLFPPNRTRAALVDDRTAPETAARYRYTAAAVGADVNGPFADADTRRANAALSLRFAAHIRADLDARYRTPGAAASDVTVDEVEIVIGRWEP
jgi:hypothetical protein